jgi:hypothetical protein
MRSSRSQTATPWWQEAPLQGPQPPQALEGSRHQLNRVQSLDTSRGSQVCNKYVRVRLINPQDCVLHRQSSMIYARESGRETYQVGGVGRRVNCRREASFASHRIKNHRPRANGVWSEPIVRVFAQGVRCESYASIPDERRFTFHRFCDELPD